MSSDHTPVRWQGGGALLAMLVGISCVIAGVLVGIGWWLHGVFQP